MKNTKITQPIENEVEISCNLKYNNLYLVIRKPNPYCIMKKTKLKFAIYASMVVVALAVSAFNYSPSQAKADVKKQTLAELDASTESANPCKMLKSYDECSRYDTTFYHTGGGNCQVDGEYHENDYAEEIWFYGVITQCEYGSEGCVGDGDCIYPY